MGVWALVLLKSWCPESTSTIDFSLLDPSPRSPGLISLFPEPLVSEAFPSTAPLPIKLNLGRIISRILCFTSPSLLSPRPYSFFIMKTFKHTEKLRVMDTHYPHSTAVSILPYLLYRAVFIYLLMHLKVSHWYVDRPHTDTFVGPPKNRLPSSESQYSAGTKDI